MNTKIFRKVSLERLASPERLDQAYRVTRPKEWLALLAMFFVLAAAVVWGFEGSLATRVSAQGVIIGSGGVVNVVSSGSGQLVSLEVKSGDEVRQGQVIARIAQPDLTERIRIAQDNLADARRERERSLRVHNDSAALQLDAMARERANLGIEIDNLQSRVKLTSEEIPVDDQLLARGLITKQQNLAPKEKILELQAEIATAQARIKQIDAQTFSVKGQPGENDVDMQARVTELERNLLVLKKDFDTAANVVSPYAGKVLELKAYRGSAVSDGTPIVSMQPAVDSLEGLVYLSAFAAKDVRPGMEAQISPGTVRREEYGFLIGKVTSVADYPATPAAIMRVLENESLTQNIIAAGPVTEVRLKLERANTPSGFRWSSGQGPPLAITAGTLCSARVVTHEQRPVTLALPLLKERFGL